MKTKQFFYKNGFSSFVHFKLIFMYEPFQICMSFEIHVLNSKIQTFKNMLFSISKIA